MMRTAIALLMLAGASACASAHRNGNNPDLPPVTGSYRLVSIDHHGLPTHSPTEPNVIVTGGSLVLDRSHTFTLALNAATSPQLPVLQRDVRGTWSVAGDRVTLTPSQVSAGAAMGAAMTYRYWFAGGRLMLRDDQGHEYAFSER